MKKGADRHQGGDDLAPNDQSLVVRSGSDQRSLQLNAELLRHVTKRRQIVDVGTNTVQIVGVERVLGVEQAKHASHQRAEERLDDGAEIEVGTRVVGTQVGEQGREHMSVLLVQLAVGPCEHGMKVGRRTVYKLHTER